MTAAVNETTRLGPPRRGAVLEPVFMVVHRCGLYGFVDERELDDLLIERCYHPSPGSRMPIDDFPPHAKVAREEMRQIREFYAAAPVGTMKCWPVAKVWIARVVLTAANAVPASTIELVAEPGSVCIGGASAEDRHEI